MQSIGKRRVPELGVTQASVDAAMAAVRIALASSSWKERGSAVRKACRALLSLVISALFLSPPNASCASPTGESPPARVAGEAASDGDLHLKDRITVWAVDGLELPVVQETIRKFNQQQPPHPAELLTSIHRDYEDRVKNAAAAGNLPCVLHIDGPFLAEFAWPGYLRPLEDFIPQELLNDLRPTIVGQARYGSHLYGLAPYDNGLGLFANRQYLRAAGVRIPTIERPWTLQEFESALRKLASTPGVEYPLTMDLFTAARDSFARQLAPILQGFGGDLIDRKTLRSAKGILDGPASVVAMRRLQYWLKQGWTRDVNNEDFRTRKAALAWGSNGMYLGSRTALGDDLVVMPLPDFGNGIKVGNGSWGWAISSTCPHAKEAWRFIEMMMSPEAVVRMSNANGGVPARKSALALAPLYAGQGPLSVLARQLDAGFAVPRPTTPAYGTISSAFFDAVRGIVAGGEPQAELSKAALKIDQEIGLHRGYPFP